MSWYKKTWACAALLFLFFPAGVYLLWKYHSRALKPVKMGLAMAMSLMLIILCFAGCSSETTPQAFELSVKSVTLDLNESNEIQIVVTPEDSDVSSVEFVSENDKVAAFVKSEKDNGENSGSLQGKITGLKEGTTSVYVKCGEVESEKIKVVVEDKERIETERKNAAEEVSALISEIGEVSLKSYEKINDAREAYDKLEKESQAYVANYDVLTSAEETYDKLYSEALSKAEAVSEAIDNIGDVSLNSETAVNDARTAYDELDEDAKLLVENYSALQTAENTLQELKEAEAERIAEEELEKQQESATEAESSSEESYSGQTSSGNESNSSAYGTVYWTPNGEKYHKSSDCPTLSRSKTIYSGSVDEAKANGKSEACKVCS